MTKTDRAIIDRAAGGCRPVLSTRRHSASVASTPGVGAGGDRKVRAALAFALVLTLCLTLAACGCMGEGGTSGDAETAPQKLDIITTARTGPVIVAFSSYPIRPGAPPDGVRAAILASIGQRDCSAASVYWSERNLSLSWIREQLELRRQAGREPRLILAGHGLGATEASEIAKEILFADRDVVISLLLTVDAVKTGRINSTAGATGNAIANRIPGVNMSFTAYDASPAPDRKRLLAHINYYQTRSVNYHGASMPDAENHRLDDWTGLLNHGNVDDFALTFLISDLRRAMEKEPL